jgi:hypothetical protein
MRHARRVAGCGRIAFLAFMFMNDVGAADPITPFMIGVVPGINAQFRNGYGFKPRLITGL